MISIRVRYYGPTQSRGAKLVATDGTKHLRVAYQYSNDADEKLNAAKEFCRIFLPHSPELNPEPSQFNGDNFYQFLPNSTDKKLVELINQIGSSTKNNFSKKELLELLK